MNDKKIKIVIAGDVSIDSLTWPAKVKMEDRQKEIGKTVALGNTELDGDALLVAGFLRENTDNEIISQKKQPGDEVDYPEGLIHQHMRFTL